MNRWNFQNGLHLLYQFSNAMEPYGFVVITNSQLIKQPNLKDILFQKLKICLPNFLEEKGLPSWTLPMPTSRYHSQRIPSLTSLSTHSRGCIATTVYPFGVHSAPSIFQRTIEGVLRGIPKVAVYIDDILITGDSEEEHLQNLEAVLSRLEEEGLRLKKEKCEFMLPKMNTWGM